MPNAVEVIEFLQRNPRFLDEHPELLEHLVMNHDTGSGAVSLLERQIKVLRERQAASRERLADLVRVGRDNDATASRMHALTLRLLRAVDESALIESIHTSLREDFDIVSVKLLLGPAADAELEALLASGKPRCGHFGIASRRAVFADEGESIQSMALIPLGPGATLGALGLGSIDKDRFTPALSTEFLARLGELIGAAFERCRAAAA